MFFCPSLLFPVSNLSPCGHLVLHGMREPACLPQGVLDQGGCCLPLPGWMKYLHGFIPGSVSR
jgi:hypothetical protein